MFSKKQRRHTVVETLIGSNSKLNGDLHFQGGCHIDGTIKGSVTADPDTDSALSISDIGNIDGGVTVPVGRRNSSHANRECWRVGRLTGGTHRAGRFMRSLEH